MNYKAMKHTEEATESAKSEKFSLQAFVFANFVPPEQQVYIYIYIRTRR